MKRILIGLFASGYFQLFGRGTSNGVLKRTFLSAELDFHLALRRVLVANYKTVPQHGFGGFVQHSAFGIVTILIESYLERAYGKAAETLLRASPIPTADTARPRNPGVLLVGGTLGPGGTERQLVSTAIGLNSRDVPCEVLCTNLSNEVNRFFLPKLTEHAITASAVTKNNWDNAEPDTLQSTELRNFFNSTFREIPKEFHQIGDFILELNERKPRVVHTWLDDTNIKAGLAAAIVGVEKIVLCTRSVSPKNFLLFQPYMKPVYSALLALPNVTMLNNSRAGAEDYASWLGIDRGAIRVVYNGYDFDHFDKLPKQELRRFYREQFQCSVGERVVGGIFRLSEEKQPLLWLEIAIAMLELEKNLTFVVVGDGPLRETMSERISSLKLAKKILLLGYKSDALEILPSFDLFFLASRKEGLPNVLIEAQATGVPVVSFDAGGAAETYCPDNTGILLSSVDVDSIAARVLALLANGQWLHDAAKQAPDFVKARFSSVTMIDSMMESYH